MAKRTISLALREEWMENFASYLKSKRRKRGLSQLTLSQCIGVNQTMISKLELAQEHPTRELAADIGEYFDEPQAAMAAAGYIPFVGWRP